MNSYSTTPNRNTATLLSSSPRRNPIKHSPPYPPLLQHMTPSTFSFMPSNNTPSNMKLSPPYSSKIPSTNNLKQSPPYTSKTHNDSTSSSDASPGGNRSRSFSITDILADNNTTSSVSRKRTSPSESSVSSQEKTPRVVASEGGLLSPTSTATPATSGGQQQQGLLSLMQASGVVMSPVNACLPVSPALCQSTTGPYQNQVAGYFHPLSMLASTHAPPSTQSFFPTTLSGVSQPMRGGAHQTGVYSVLPNQLQENMADMKLVSSQLDDSGTADSLHDASYGSIDEDSAANVNGRNGHRSALKKLDINEHTPNTNNANSNIATTPVNTTPKSSVRYSQQQQPSHAAPYIPNYISWSPLQLPNPAATFSPSIFLTCPSGPLPPSSMVHPVPRSSPQNLSSPDEKIPGVVGGANPFMTSTPIRRGDRIQLVSPSRVHSPIANTSGSKRGSRIQQQQQMEQNTSSNEHNSSASDSEMPLLHRPRVPRRRPPKARTSLNPLLENTNPSPSAAPPPVRPSLPPPSAPPSSLLTSYKLSSQQYPSFSDSGIVPDSSSSSMLYRSSYGPLMSPVGHYQHQQKTPVKGRLDRGGGGGGGGAYGRILCGSSPVTDHLNKTGQIQSVPPWFICSDKKSDGKRLRLTEAINKSLSESVTQKHLQLPAEWQTLAYGQTEDQKSLTRKARNFLKGRPRVLKFDGAGSSSSSGNKKKVSQ